MDPTSALTTETAADYVRATVADWGADWAAANIAAAFPAKEDGMDVVIVPTSMGAWTVWAQPDGTLYGEC